MSSPDSAAAAPVLRIVRGNPSAEEIAALVAVLSAAGGEVEGGSTPHTPGWVDHAAAVHAPTHNGPGGWRTSARRA